MTDVEVTEGMATAEGWHPMTNDIETVIRYKIPRRD